jgi:diguanylate cyclase (GGDEF)-like protein/PAS domain S-box-containing protein
MGTPLIARVWRTLRQEVRACSLTELPPRIAAKVRLQQLNSLSVVLAVMAISGATSVPLVLFEYWNVGLHPLLLSIGGMIACAYVVLAIMSLRWSLGRRIARASSERVLSQFVRVCMWLGIAWGTLLIILMRYADPGERSMLYGVIVGLMSAAVVVTPPSAAFAFWLPISVSGLIAIALISTVSDFGGDVLLLGYMSLSLFCLLYLNRALIRRVIAEISQSDGRETIDMLLREFEDSASDWLWETDQFGRLIHVSKRFAEVAGTQMGDLLGTHLLGLIERYRRQTVSELLRRSSDEANMAGFMACQMPFRDVEVSLEIEGKPVWWALTGKPKFSDQHVFDGYRGVGSDITQRKMAIDRAQFLAHYDELTGLANRRLFREMLSRHLHLPGSSGLALLCLDLDGFKIVNDSYGHPVGDQLLIAVARRLEGQVRGTEFCARLGGDEFAIVVPNAGPTLLEVMARRLVVELSKPYPVEGMQLDVGVSIGIATVVPGESSSETVLRDADAAMYQAKGAGRGTFRFFDRDISERNTRRRVLQNDLKQAIDNDGLRLDYQPIFSLGTGQLSSVEALVRWNRKSGGALAPSEFVPLAESSGLIDDLGEWVLARACQEAARLPAPLKLAINVSPLQLGGQRLVSHMRRVLASSRFDPYRLELELTETAFLDMNEATLGVLLEIRRLGIEINLDDFGVGQTSLSQLKRFPFNTLKIDQSFVRDMPTNPSSLAIVRGMTSIATELGIRITAEGIETPAQLELVRSLGCHNGQGFLLGRPMPMRDILAIPALGAREYVEPPSQ